MSLSMLANMSMSSLSLSVDDALVDDVSVDDESVDNSELDSCFLSTLRSSLIFEFGLRRGSERSVGVDSAMLRDDVCLFWLFLEEEIEVFYE